MKSNLRLLLGISLLFGISTGIYEYVLPLFLDAQKVSYQNMGVIFALAGLVMVVARIYMGGLADRWGRKPLYGWALAVCGAASALTPFVPTYWIWQTLLKTLRDIGSLTRETIYPVILYEEQRAGFLNRIGKYRGFEFLLQAGGTLLVLVVINLIGPGIGTYRVLFLIAGGAVCLAALWWTRFTETYRPQAQRILPLRELVNFDLHRNLLLIMCTGLLLSFGVTLSHSFFLQLFFIKHFHASEQVTIWIMVAHRATIALPLLLVGNLRIQNLRAWYIVGICLEGVTIAGAAIVPSLGWSAAIFLLHDLVGAGLWTPIQAMLIQRYSRDATRGTEVGKVLAWSSVGAIFAPIVTGILAAHSSALPFLASGVLTICAAVPLCWLKTDAPSPASATPEPVVL